MGDQAQIFKEKKMKKLFVIAALAFSSAFSAESWFISSVNEGSYTICNYKEVQKDFLQATKETEYVTSERLQFFQRFIADRDQVPELAAFMEMTLLKPGMCKTVESLKGLRITALSVVKLN